MQRPGVGAAGGTEGELHRGAELRCTAELHRRAVELSQLAELGRREYLVEVASAHGIG